MTVLHVAFEDFEGGERGLVGDMKPMPGTFNAVNMLKTIKGELCVRPGLHNITPAGIGNGRVWAFGATDNSNHNCFFVQGTTVYGFKGDGTGLTAYTGALSMTPTEHCPYIDNGLKLYLVNRGDGIYELDPSSLTCTKLTGAPGGRTIARYGNRLLTANYDDSIAYRIRYSDDNNFNSWPAANFVDSGNGFGVGALYEQNNHLAIMKQESFWILEGVPGYNDTLRKVVRLNGGLNQFHGAVGYLDEIVYQGLGEHVPGRFNGVKAVNLHSLTYGLNSVGIAGGPDLDVGVFAVRGADEGFVLIENTTYAATYLQNTWNFHKFNVPVIGLGSNPGNIDNIILVTDGGGTSTSPKFYTWNPTAVTPGIVGGDSMMPGDDSTTPIVGSITMPEYWQTIFRGVGNHEFRVSKVVIDFRAFNTSGAQNNQIDLQIRGMRVDDSADFTSAAQTWTESPSASTTSGSVRRAVFLPETLPAGNAFQLLLTNLKGVAIQGFQITLNPVIESKA